MDDREPESKLIFFTSNNKNGSSRCHANHRHCFRRILSQVLVAVTLSLLFLDLGMILAVPTIVVGALHNAKEGLSLDDAQSSWFVSIMFLMQPSGSVVSGYVQGALGRRRSMLLVNAPMLAAWYLLHSAESAAGLYAASLAVGFGIGFLEAPALAYVGEISEPRFRGTLATLVSSNVTAGILLEFYLGFAFPSWRRAMLVSCSVPVLAALALSQIPESPVWLLTKGKKSEAMSALKWLRGWVSDDEVIDEFHSLESYCETSKNDYRTQWETRIKRKAAGYTGVPDGENNTPPAGKPGFVDIVRDFLRPEMLRPLRLVIVLFFFSHVASLTAMRPYMIEVFTRLEVSGSPSSITVVSALLQCAGALTCICLVRLVGKRALSLASMTSCALCCLSLGAYAYAMRRYNEPSVPLCLFFVLYYSMNAGIGFVPWLLISEVFPTRGRGVASGVCTAAYYVIAFLVSKTWLNLNELVGLHGCFLLYGTMGVLGVVYVFICMPETEGKTLVEIEKYFSSKTVNRPIVNS